MMKKFACLIILISCVSFTELSYSQCTATITPAGPLTFCSGGSVTLNANTAPGNTYIWKRNSTIVQSGSSASYIASVTGGYTVQLTTSTGCTATSAISTVTILTNGAGITANGYTGDGCLNGGMNLSAVAAPGNTYQWKLNGGNLGGATASTYSATIAGNYTCQITNGGCSVLSNTINAQYQAATVDVSGPTVFCTPGNTSFTTSLNIGWGGNTTYQWQLNNVDIPGATGWGYTPTGSGGYRCRITSSGFCNAPTYSNTVNLQSGTAPMIYINTIAQGPTTADACTGFADLILFDASSNAPYFGPELISWYKNGNLITPGVGGPYLQVYESGYYDAMFNGACGLSTAQPFGVRMLNQYSPPQITTYSGQPSCSPAYLEVDGGTVVYDSYQWKLNGIVIAGATQSIYAATQSGNYSCVVSNSCDSLESVPAYMTIYPDPTNAITVSSTNLCSNGTVTFTVPYSSNFSYHWQLNGSIIPGAVSSTYVASQPGQYDCKVNSTCGSTVYTNAIVITTVNPPVAKITSPVATSACSGNVVNLAATTGSGFIYRWLRNNTPISNTGQAVYTATTSGRYSVIITDANACADTSEQAPVFFGLPAVTITSTLPSPVCPNAYITLTANVTNGIPDSYQWKLNGADMAGKTAATLPVTASAAGTYTVTVTNPCGTFTSGGYVVTLKTATPASITAAGPTGFCPPGNVTLQANTGTGLSYQWYRTYSNYPIPGATASSIVADTTAVFWVQVTSAATGCMASSNQIKTNRNGTVPGITPIGTTAACNSQVITANNAPGFTYQWRKDGINISGATAQSYTVTSSADYTVAMTGGCGTAVSDAVEIEIYTGPFAYTSSQIYPSATSACDGSGLSIGINRFILPPYVSNISIQWLLNGNAYGPPVIPTSWLTWLIPTVSGNYSMQVTNVCGTQTSQTEAITIYPLPVVSISASGPVTFCNGSSVVLNASTGAGNTRQWRRNNQDINNATGSSYTANVAGSYTCIVTSVNGCKSLSNEIDVQVNGGIPSVQASNGSYYICKNTSGNIYSIAPVSGATNYTWTVPAGASITSGQGTTSITLSFGSTAVNGSICVYATVPCGNGPSSCIPVRIVSAKPAMPASILGPAYPCASTTSKIYSCGTVLNASGYTWTVPANAVITSGQGTDRITVDFNSSFTSGEIKVSAFNCKGSSASQKLNVYGKPLAPTVTGPTVGVCPETQQVYLATSPGATSFVWSAPANATISNGQYTSSATVYFNSQYVKDTLFVDARNSCGISPLKSVIIKTVPNVPGSITGPASVCANQTGVGYSISTINGAQTYQWDVPAGSTVASGQGMAAVSVNFGASSGNVKVRSGNACGYSNYKTKPVAITCRGDVTQPNDQVSVFPNPAADVVTVSLNNNSSRILKIKLYDITGRLLIEKTNPLSDPGNTVSMNIMDYSPGYYLLNVETSEHTYVENIVIK